MASRRTMFINDRKRTSAARKLTHKQTIERAQEQAKLLQKLTAQARAEAKSSS